MPACAGKEQQERLRQASASGRQACSAENPPAHASGRRQVWGQNAAEAAQDTQRCRRVASQFHAVVASARWKAQGRNRMPSCQTATLLPNAAVVVAARNGLPNRAFTSNATPRAHKSPFAARMFMANRSLSRTTGLPPDGVAAWWCGTRVLPINGAEVGVTPTSAKADRVAAWQVCVGAPRTGKCYVRRATIQARAYVLGFVCSHVRLRSAAIFLARRRVSPT